MCACVCCGGGGGGEWTGMCVRMLTLGQERNGAASGKRWKPTSQLPSLTRHLHLSCGSRGKLQLRLKPFPHPHCLPVSTVERWNMSPTARLGSSWVPPPAGSAPPPLSPPHSPQTTNQAEPITLSLSFLLQISWTQEPVPTASTSSSPVCAPLYRAVSYPRRP